MKLVGEKAIGPFLVELEKDNLKMSKIKENCEKAVITVKVPGTKKERPTTAPAKVAEPRTIVTRAAAKKQTGNLKKNPIFKFFNFSCIADFYFYCFKAILFIDFFVLLFFSKKKKQITRQLQLKGNLKFPQDRQQL